MEIEDRDKKTTRRGLSLEEAGAYLGISKWSIRALINRGDLPAVRIGRRILIDRYDLDNLIETNKRSEEPI